MRNITVLGVFDDRDNAEEAINSLKDEGFTAKDISIMMQDKDDAREVSNNTGVDVAGGAATGATTGAVIGGIAGLLAGIGAIAIPGIGAILIGGPIATVLGLTGAAATTVSGAATGALAGGLIGALMSLGVPREQAEVYERRIKEGAILIAVPATHRTDAEIKDILEEEGATDIHVVRGKNEDSDDRHDRRSVNV